MSRHSKTTYQPYYVSGDGTVSTAYSRKSARNGRLRVPFILGDIPSNIAELDDSKFSEVVLTLLSNLDKLFSKYLFNEATGKELFTKKLGTNLRRIPLKNRRNLEALFCDPRFINFLALLQARSDAEGAVQEFDNLFKSLYKDDKLTNEETAFLGQEVNFIHYQTWHILIGDPKNSILATLLQIETHKAKGKVDFSPLRKLKSVGLVVTNYENHAKGLIRQLTANTPETETDPDPHVRLAQQLIEDFLMAYMDDPERISGRIATNSMELRADAKIEMGRRFNGRAFFYDLLFENSPNKGFLRIIHTDDSTAWLTKFFSLLLITATSLEHNLDTDLDDSFHENEDALKEAMSKVSDKYVDNFKLLNSTLTSILKNAGYREIIDNIDNCVQALTTLFLPAFDGLKTIKRGSSADALASKETVYREKFLCATAPRKIGPSLLDEDSTRVVLTIRDQLLDIEGAHTPREDHEKKPTPDPDAKPTVEKQEAPSRWQSFLSIFPCHRRKMEAAAKAASNHGQDKSKKHQPPTCEPLRRPQSIT